MKAALLNILLACLCHACLCHGTYIPVKYNVDMERLAGKWYPIWTAKPDRGERAVFAYTIEPLPNGDIILKLEIPQGDSCRLSRAILTRKQPGVFTTPDGQGVVVLMETDYYTYHISHFTKGSTYLVHLYARDRQVTYGTMNTFLNLVKFVGLDPDRRFPLRLVDMCTSPPEEA